MRSFLVTLGLCAVFSSAVLHRNVALAEGPGSGGAGIGCCKIDGLLCILDTSRCTNCPTFQACGSNPTCGCWL